VTFRWAEADLANDDAAFAAHAASGLPLADHVVLPQADLPSVYSEAGQTGDTEAPYCFARTWTRVRRSAAVLSARGSRYHLAGHGGDELFVSDMAYLHPLLRRRPVTAITHLRGYQALRRWPWAVAVSALADRGDLGAWWRQQAEQLTTGPVPHRTPTLGWGHPLRAPGWVTPAAAETARAVLRSAGDAAQSLATDRGQHTTLAGLRIMGPHYRLLSRVFATMGLRLELPYLDDRVIEAGLAVRLHERAGPWRYKPLLVEAMRPLLPEVIAARTTKGNTNEDVRVGLRQHLTEILDVFADSALATHGLINPDLLRRHLLSPQAAAPGAGAMLEDVLSCESWLRAVQDPECPRRNSAAAATP
jgi:asparagine synthase (glutamine-hydrolysing)